LGDIEFVIENDAYFTGKSVMFGESGEERGEVFLAADPHSFD
jgi:hypothetical protein